MASANPKTVQGGRLKATRNGAEPKAERPPMLPGLDPPLCERALKPRAKRAKAPRPPKPPKAPRTPKPKLTPIQREAMAIADPEAREARGKTLYAELKAAKERLVAKRAALPWRPSPAQLAAFYARYDAERLKHDHGYLRDYKRDRDRMMSDPLSAHDELRVQIAALTAQQNEIFYAYASDAKRVAWEAERAEREAAKAERERLYHLAQGPF
jgi:hypothetical protein